MKKQLKQNEKVIVKLRDDLYTNINQIDCIIKVNKHPTDNTVFENYKYCVYFIKNAHFTWALLSQEEFEINLKPFI